MTLTHNLAGLKFSTNSKFHLKDNPVICNTGLVKNDDKKGNMFITLQGLVEAQFQLMAKHDLFETDAVGTELVDAYLNGFPEAERQEHNCNCCKSFIRQYGNIVAINGDQIMTIWDVQAPAEYKNAIAALHEKVKNSVITKPFVTTFAKLGTKQNRALGEDGKVIVWNHFNVVVPNSKVLRGGSSAAAVAGGKLATKDVFERSLKEITIEAVDTVLDLINENSIYRGAEFKAQVAKFKAHKAAYLALKNESQRSLFAWVNADAGGRIRNTAIGTLLVDLSNGVDIERAVASFERIMSPANYRRTTAVVTTKMIEKAKETCESLGLTSAMQRRHATVDDVPVTNLLFVNRDSSTPTDPFESAVVAAATTNVDVSKARKVKLDQFLSDVMPKVTNLKLLFTDNMNLASLIAPVDAEARSLFSWGNGLSWTYQNNMADVIKEKVKSAGGKVDGELRASLEWFNYDDLDLHVTEPSGNIISFRSRRSPTGGELDVDANAGSGKTREPVENIVWPFGANPKAGKYRVEVHQFSLREYENPGFNLQIEAQGTVFNLRHPSVLRAHERELCATFDYSPSKGISNFKTSLEYGTAGREVANMQLGSFQDIKMMMYSPNHWDGKEKGNKHLFMILEGAKINDPLRPFFNEYLAPELHEHRKVFEMLSSRMMVQPSEDQLTGVGFSLTQANKFVVMADKQMYEVEI